MHTLPRSLSRTALAVIFSLAVFFGPTLEAAEAHSPVEVASIGPEIIRSETPDGAAIVRLGEETLILGGVGADGWLIDVIAIGADGARTRIATDIGGFRDAATLIVDDRIVVLGGSGASGPLATAHALRRDGAGLVSEVWPKLPFAGSPAGAALLRERVYVLAGPEGETTDGTDFWSIDPQRLRDGWRVEPRLPAPPRKAAAFAVQHGGLHVLGGRSSAADVSGSREAWVFLPKPREASVVSGWQRLPDAPVPILAGSAWPTGQASLVVHADTPDGARLLIFNAVTSGWATLDATPLPPGSRRVATAKANLVLAPETPSAPGGLRIIEPARYSKTLGIADYGVLVAYFALMAGIGLFFSSKQESAEEFTLGGRKVRWWAAGLSMFATGASSISFLAIPAMAYQTNAIWILPLFMMFVAFLLQGWLIFPLLRRMEITSTFEYLERRFGSSLRLIASAQAILFQTVGRTTVVLVLPAMALSATTGISVVWSVVIMGLLTTVYTAIGGFHAVIWTDVVQGLMMLLTPVIVVILVAMQVPGGFAGGWDLLAQNDKLILALPSWDVTLPAAWILCVAALFQHTVNLAGDQPVIQRVFSTPLPALRRTSATYIVSGFVIGVLVNAIGFALYVYFHHYPQRLLLGSNNDQVLPAFLVTALPAGMAGLVIAAVFAAAMSTVSSSMNSVATLLHQDFYKRFVPAATPRQNLRFLKLTAYVIGLVGTAISAYMATLQITSMFALWNTILGLLGGGIVGLYSLGMFTRRANTAGALTGVAASIGWSLWLKTTDAHFMVYLPSAILVCMVVGYGASLVLPGRNRDLTGLTVFTPTAAGK